MSKKSKLLAVCKKFAARHDTTLDAWLKKNPDRYGPHEYDPKKRKYVYGVVPVGMKWEQYQLEDLYYGLRQSFAVNIPHEYNDIAGCCAAGELAYIGKANPKDTWDKTIRSLTEAYINQLAGEFEIDDDDFDDYSAGAKILIHISYQSEVEKIKAMVKHGWQVVFNTPGNHGKPLTLLALNACGEPKKT